MVTGHVIQVFADGAVRFSWPLQIRQAKDASSDASSRPRPQSKNGFLPGCSEDVEIMRTITPLGTLTRNQLSGRVEIYHADGSTAMRNPTLEEMRAQLERF